MGNAAEQGAYLLERLRSLQTKYPALMSDVRGRGLRVGLELSDISQGMPRGTRTLVSGFDKRLRGALTGFVGALLLHEYDVLVAFTEYNRNVIRLEPPLIVERSHIDHLVESLDDLLSRGVARIARDYLRKIKLKH
jgi:acetylornithine/succinyldiaminopimelate/putrescine aminotransferase